ncbi:MAG: rhomboid family intramembrane serine protease [Prevotellaceae bacterium]|jgi:membrane associated rhomboid family serine protease|nr:rhomboid family intramembrane serine protease [Prevotellaceae bacterium]
MNTIPTVTKNLLIINALFFLATLVAPKYGIHLEQYLGLHYFLAKDFNLAQLITYMFMHGGFTHLFFNMFAVWMFGSLLERTWGARRYLFYYMVCGIGAGLIQLLVAYLRIRMLEPHITPEMMAQIYDQGAAIILSGQNYVDPIWGQLNALYNAPTVGASGAIFGILLGFGMSYPDERIIVFPIPIPIKAKYLVIGYALIELYSGVLNNPYDNVAHFAHLGGMLFGLILMLYWRHKDKLKGNGFYYQ